MSSESVYQVARSWVDVGSFKKLLILRFNYFLQRLSGMFCTPLVCFVEFIILLYSNPSDENRIKV
jgi:hypothetical protein